jgi:hypothetical protein
MVWNVMSLHTSTIVVGLATATTGTIVTTATATTGCFVLEERQHTGWQFASGVSRCVDPDNNTKPISAVDQRYE